MGETVRILTGNAMTVRTDMAFESPNSLGLVFKAFYNSRAIFFGTLGYGWSHTYEARLAAGFTVESQNAIRIMDETGRAHFFADNGTGSYPGLLAEKSRVQDEAGEYVWHRLDGSRCGFSADGKPAWIEDPKSNRLTLGYDAQGALQTVTDTASGRTLTFYYDNGRLDHIIGPVTDAVADGVWVQFGYDGHHNLTAVTYADGSGIIYSYEDPNDTHNLTEMRNAADHLLGTWTYDAQDRCTAYADPGDLDAAVAYVGPTQVDVTDAYGTIRSYTIEEIGGRKRVSVMTGPAGAPYTEGSIRRWEYDTQLNLIEVETVGGTLHQYQNFDSRGNPGTVILAAGALEERMITYTFHPEMNVALTRTEAGVLGGGNKVTIWDYDDDGDAVANENPTRLLYRIIEQGFTKDAAGAVVPYEYVTAFTYNVRGQVLTIDGPLAGAADTTSFAYDGATGNLLSITRPLIGAVSFSDYAAAGQVGLVTDVNSQSESFDYDGKGRITALTHGADYSARSVSYTTAGRPDITTDEDGVSFDYDYEASFGRLALKTDMDGNYIAYAYDGQGNLIEKSKHKPDGTRTSRMRWDYQQPVIPGLLYREIRADDSFAQYDYDAEGNLAAVTDYESNTTYYDYDGLNRLVTVTQPGSAVTSYYYDAHGNPVSVVDAENKQTTFVYDDMGRVVSTTSPDTGTVSFVYDAAGNLVQKTDAKAVAVQYVYDLLNRLTQVNFPDSSQNLAYTYDQGTYGLGRRTGMTDPAGSTDFGYDARGRLVAKTATVDLVAYPLTRTFTAAGRLSGMVYPSGRTLDLTRYADGRLQKIETTQSSTTLTLLDNLSYNPFGSVAGLSTGAGGAVSNQAGECDCLESINPGSMMEQIYTYDRNRNLTEITAANTPWFNQSFEYDALSRLTRASGNYGTIDYTYDKVGNRLTRTMAGAVDTYAYQNGTHRLASVSGAHPASYSYDANGNIDGIDGRQFIYNQNNRLIRVEEAAQVLGEYAYNALGQRITKTVDSQTVVFHYDFDGNIIAESDANGTFAAEYLYMGTNRLASVDAATGTVYYYLNNHLGTPVLMTDGSGTAVWEVFYKPFGDADVNENSTVVNNFRYAGQYFDAETGLHYNYNRYYDPTTGRYLTPDPIGLAGGINLYTYVSNNPINAIDPLGLETMVLPGPVPLPIIPPKTQAQQAADSQLANALHNAWMDYVHPPLIAAGDLLYGGGIGDWIYDVTHPASDDVCLTMGKGKGDKYGPLWDAPGMPGWKNPANRNTHDPDWWEDRPPDYDKWSKWKKLWWNIKKAFGSGGGAGGVGI